MRIVARKHMTPSLLIRGISSYSDSATAFDEGVVNFDFSTGRVVRSSGGNSTAIAEIHQGGGKNKLRDFIGRVEADWFEVTVHKQRWLSLDAAFEITLKDRGFSVINRTMLYDFHHSFRVAGILELKLARDGKDQGYRYKIEGVCSEECRDLAEIVACLLLHRNEQISAS